MTRRAVILTVATLVCVCAWGSESYHPPEGGSWQMARMYLKPTGPFREATGVTVFACNLAETQHRAQVYATGVRADRLYTLWLVKMDGANVASKYELTSRWRPLRSDVNGAISFVGNLPWCPIGHDAFVIKYHPNDQRGGFWAGITVLKGYLKAME